MKMLLLLLAFNLYAKDIGGGPLGTPTPPVVTKIDNIDVESLKIKAQPLIEWIKENFKTVSLKEFTALKEKLTKLEARLAKLEGKK